MTDDKTPEATEPASAPSETQPSEAGVTEATSVAEPTVQGLQKKLKFSRTLNIVLGAAAAFLLVIAIAQPLAQGNTPMKPTETNANGLAPTSAPGSETARPEVDPNRPTLANQLAKADPNDPMAFGDMDAPVTVIEWTDYRCPFCASYTNNTMPELMQDYVDKGLIRYEVRDVSFFGDDSTSAAVAARAAGNQGKFAEYFEALYAAAPNSGHPDMPREKLIAFAEEAGVPDIAQFTADLDDPALTQAVNDSTQEARDLGINSVPYFVVGSTHFSGALDVSAFHKVFTEQIDEAKANKKG